MLLYDVIEWMILITKNLFLRLTFCLSLQKKESKYNPTAGHHVPRSIALLIEKKSCHSAA
jgi:hypothetical protein